MTTDRSDDGTREAGIMRRIDATRISDRELEGVTGVSRASIAKARKGLASPGIYDRLERWIEKFEGETGTDAPSNDLVEFRLTGNFGVDVVVRGPVSDLAALEASVERLMSRMGGSGLK